MPSDAQVAANRANAQLSIGPVSDAGRAASSQNHLSHGFASEFRILPNEDGHKFNTLVSDFLADWAPANSIERTLVTNLAEFQWLSERARRLQNQALDQIDREAVGDSDAAPKQDSAQLERLLRYHTQFDRAFHRALTALMQLRAPVRKSKLGSNSQNSGLRPKPPIKSTWIASLHWKNCANSAPCRSRNLKQRRKPARLSVKRVPISVPRRKQVAKAK